VRRLSPADWHGYDRSTPPSIVHLGVGAFARAHLAIYADDLLRAGHGATIHGVSLRSSRAEEELAPQGGLFSVTAREPDVPARTRVVGSITRVSTGVDAAVAAIADPATTLVTLTVTEKAYEADAPSVLATALAERRRRTTAPLVVASLDNVLDNGRVLAAGVREAADPALAGWIDEHVRFPRSVVDRMVPSTTDADRAEVADRLGAFDAGAVVAEAHRSWVVEHADGLPPLAGAGVDVVADVEPYQRRKLWLLNGPHSALAYLGLLAGRRTIAEAAADPRVAGFVRRLAADVLAVLPGDEAFAESSLRRFANPALGHTCAQVGADGSRKLPQRILPVMDLRRERGLPVDRLALVVAAWLAALEAGAVADPGGVPTAAAVGDGHEAAVRAAQERIARDGVHVLEEVP
jgi:fructuronate reductase